MRTRLVQIIEYSNYAEMKWNTSDPTSSESWMCDRLAKARHQSKVSSVGERRNYIWVISARFATTPFDITVIHAYALTNTSSEEKAIIETEKRHRHSNGILNFRHGIIWVWREKRTRRTPSRICPDTQYVPMQDEIRPEGESKMNLGITSWYS